MRFAKSEHAAWQQHARPRSDAAWQKYGSVVIDKPLGGCPPSLLQHTVCLPLHAGVYKTIYMININKINIPACRKVKVDMPQSHVSCGRDIKKTKTA